MWNLPLLLILFLFIRTEVFLKELLSGRVLGLEVLGAFFEHLDALFVDLFGLGDELACFCPFLLKVLLFSFEFLDGLEELVQGFFVHLLLGLNLGFLLFELDLLLKQLLFSEFELFLVQLVLLLELLFFHHKVVLLLNIRVVVLLFGLNDLGHQLILVLDLLLDLHTEDVQLVHLLLIPYTLIVDQVLQMDNLVTDPVLFVRVFLDLLSCVALDFTVLLMRGVDKVLVDGGLRHLVVRIMA